MVLNVGYVTIRKETVATYFTIFFQYLRAGNEITKELSQDSRQPHYGDSTLLGKTFALNR